jgi:hypothetical protein
MKLWLLILIWLLTGRFLQSVHTAIDFIDWSVLTFLFAFVSLGVQLYCAPEGYEDHDGFHFRRKANGSSALPPPIGRQLRGGGTVIAST